MGVVVQNHLEGSRLRKADRVAFVRVACEKKLSANASCCRRDFANGPLESAKPSLREGGGCRRLPRPAFSRFSLARFILFYFFQFSSVHFYLYFRSAPVKRSACFPAGEGIMDAILRL
ncbi:Hypothetical predicted protein [Podarcis lilfordi]|uniref:Transmembrane protein n=1 Tax=Podarcis lilfordi TaxID=74358 RepID=A0AA35KRC6_9SAUR|nr:Hypothetical predicted protein [Podarcis lilfordi]